MLIIGDIGILILKIEHEPCVLLTFLFNVSSTINFDLKRVLTSDTIFILMLNIDWANN